MNVGAVAIGRNEGERLKRCLASLSAAARGVYVDSGSTDGSAEWARDQGADVIELDMNLPFTAARARNAGFRPPTRASLLRSITCSLSTATASSRLAGQGMLVSSSARTHDVAAVAGGGASAIRSDRSTIGCATGNGTGRPAKPVHAAELHDARERSRLWADIATI